MDINAAGDGGAPTDGGNVGLWRDISGNARHLTRSVNDTAKPFYYATWLDYEFPAVDFTQGTDGMNNNAVGAALAGVAVPFTVFTVWLTDTVVTQGRYLWHLSQTSADNARAWQKYNLHSTTAGFPFVDFVRNTSTGSTERDTGNTPQGYGGSGVLHITAAVYDGTTLKTYQNGQLAHSHTCAFAGTATFATFGCGCNFNGSSFNTGGPVMLSQAVFAEAFNLGKVNRLTQYFSRRLSIPYSPSSGVVRVACLGDSHVARRRTQQDFRGWPQLWQRDGATPAEAAGMTVRAVQGAPMTADHVGTSPNVTEQWEATKAMMGRGDFLHIKGVANDIFNITQANIDEQAEWEARAVELLADMFVVVDEAVETNDCNVVIITESPVESVADYRMSCLNYFVETVLPPKCANYDRVILADTFSALVDRTQDPDGLLELYDVGDNAHLNAAGVAVQHDVISIAHAALRFDPRDIASIVRWWSGRQGALFADNDAIGDGGAELIDRSTTEDHAAQSIAGSRPTWQAAVSGLLPAVRFDGTDDHLDFTELELSSSQAPSGNGWTIIYSADPGDLGEILGRNTGNGFVAVSGESIHIGEDGGGDLVIGGDLTIAAFDIVMIRSDGRCWVNGVEFPAATNTLVGDVTLDRISGQAEFMGDIADLMIANEDLSIDNMNRIGNYLAGQYTRRDVSKTWTPIA